MCKPWEEELNVFVVRYWGSEYLEYISQMPIELKYGNYRYFKLLHEKVSRDD